MIHRAIPRLPSLDLDRTARFYSEKLGFKIISRNPDLLIVAMDDASLHFWRCSDPLIPKASSVYLRVSDIESIYEVDDRLGVVHPNAPLEDQPWGMKEFASLDPDGNLFKFGQSSFR